MRRIGDRSVDLARRAALVRRRVVRPQAAHDVAAVPLDRLHPLDRETGVEQRGEDPREVHDAIPVSDERAAELQFAVEVHIPDLQSPLASGWKCHLSDFPPTFQILQKLPEADGISFPLQAVADLAGLQALEKVEIIWLATKNPEEIRHLLSVAVNEYHLDLEVKPLSLALATQTELLAHGTKLFLLGAAALLLISLILYVQGVHAAMRREIGLRACLGAPFYSIAIWLSSDVLTQVIFLETLSFALTLLPQMYFIGLNLSTLFTLFIYIQLGLFCLFIVLSTLVVWHLMRQAKLIVILRD